MSTQTVIDNTCPLTTTIVQQGNTTTVTVVGVPGPATPGSGAAISADAGNRAVAGTDGGVYVRDDLVPDPLAYYILAKA